MASSQLSLVVAIVVAVSSEYKSHSGTNIKISAVVNSCYCFSCNKCV